ACHIVAGGLVVAHAGSDDDVDCAVELAVAGSGEPMAGGVSRRCWQRCYSSKGRESGFRSHAAVVGVRGDENRAGDCSDSGNGLQTGCESFGELGEVAVIVLKET